MTSSKADFSLFFFRPIVDVLGIIMGAFITSKNFLRNLPWRGGESSW